MVKRVIDKDTEKDLKFDIQKVVNSDGLQVRKAKGGDVKITGQRRTTTAPNRALTEMVKAQRGEIKINPSEVRRQVGGGPETEYMLKKRRGPELTAMDTLLILKMYQWINGQSDYTNISDPLFLCNKYTGERGAVVIGKVKDDGDLEINWPKLAADLNGIKEPKTSKEIASIKSETESFRRTVHELCYKKEKRFIGAYDEIQPDGKATRIYKIITPLDFHISERDGKKYPVLQLNEYFTNNGQSFVTWPTFGANFFDQFRNMKHQQATISLVIELISMTAASIKNQAINKGKTKGFRDKGDERTYIVEKGITLKKLLLTICKPFVENRKYADVWKIFGQAIRNANNLGILNDVLGDKDFKEWTKTGAKPTAFKSYPEFYDNTTITLCIKKVV